SVIAESEVPVLAQSGRRNSDHRPDGGWLCRAQDEPEALVQPRIVGDVALGPRVDLRGHGDSLAQSDRNEEIEGRPGGKVPGAGEEVNLGNRPGGKPINARSEARNLIARVGLANSPVEGDVYPRNTVERKFDRA